MASVTLSALHSRIKTRVETVSGFKQSLRPIRPDFDPATLADKRFAIELETANTGLLRDKESSYARLEQRVTVRFLRRLSPKQQVSKYTDSLDDEVAIIRALTAQTGAWQYDLRVSFETSSREGLQGGEWLLVTMLFSIIHDLALTA